MMNKRYSKKESRGLPGGPHEQLTYVTGVFMQDMYHVPKAQEGIEGPRTYADSAALYNAMISEFNVADKRAELLGRPDYPTKDQMPLYLQWGKTNKDWNRWKKEDPWGIKGNMKPKPYTGYTMDDHIKYYESGPLKKRQEEKIKKGDKIEWYEVPPKIVLQNLALYEDLYKKYKEYGIKEDWIRTDEPYSSQTADIGYHPTIRPYDFWIDRTQGVPSSPSNPMYERPKYPVTEKDKAITLLSNENFKKYLETPQPSYRIHDYMKMEGMDPSFENRDMWARMLGIKDYKGKGDQNQELIKKLKEYKKNPIRAQRGNGEYIKPFTFGSNEMPIGKYGGEGYRIDAPGYNDPYKVIPSGNITMTEQDGGALKKGPLLGIDNMGNQQMMFPGYNYVFPGDEVMEIPVAQKGKSFEDWYKSVPTEKSDTSLYNLRRAFELAPKKDLQEFTNDPNSHLYTVYPNNKGEYEFIKSKNHPTLQKELDWYYSNEGSDFRSKYELDTSEDFYKYVPRKPRAQEGYQVKPRKGVRKNPDGTESTHLMMREFVPDKGWVVFPSLFQNQDSSWIDFNKTHDLKKTGFNPVYQEALKRGEVYEFGENMEEAINFADKGSWKKQTGGGVDEFDRILKKYTTKGWPSLTEEEKNFYSEMYRGNLPQVTVQADGPNPVIDAMRQGRNKLSNEISTALLEGTKEATGYNAIKDIVERPGYYTEEMRKALNDIIFLNKVPTANYSDLMNLAELAPGVGLVGKGAKKAGKALTKVPLKNVDNYKGGLGAFPGTFTSSSVGRKASKIPPPKFKSEIDWAKWNSKTPKDKVLMDEYTEIEKRAKANGTWMKNPDGTPFVGSNPTAKELSDARIKMTPEEAVKAQFIQQQSEAFKNSFGESMLMNKDGIFHALYHGSPHRNIKEFKSPKRNSRFIKNSLTTKDNDYIYFSPTYNRGLGNSHGSRVYPTYANIKNPEFTDDYMYLANPYNSIEKVKRNDAITNINFNTMRSSNHPLEVAIPFANKVKSALGNVGTFDMTNPNIYKGLFGAIGTDALLSQDTKQQGGEFQRLVNKYTTQGWQSLTDQEKQTYKEMYQQYK